MYLVNLLYILIFILLFIILILLIKYQNIKNNEINEHFDNNAWTDDQLTKALANANLNDIQTNTVKNMIDTTTQSKLKELISTQSPLLVGPQGAQGPQGPSGTTLIASGRLINKSGSFNNSDNKNNLFLPEYVVTRTEGTNPTASLSFMDNISPFAPFQYWQLDIQNNLKNRFDGSCLTMNQKQDKLYMDKCDNTNPNQKWSWDNTNRIISTTASTDKNLKCIGLTSPEKNVVTTNIPTCVGETCLANGARRYLYLKECDINNTNEDEIWAFF
jgi:hypothetical protein